MISISFLIIFIIYLLVFIIEYGMLITYKKKGCFYMAVSSKIKALLKLKSKDNAALAEHLGISTQAFSNKLYRNSFSAADLIKIADFLDCDLAFISDDGTKITLDKGDIKPDK